MKNVLLLILLIGFNKLSAQSLDNKLIIGSIDSVHSNILNQERKIWVSVPD